MSKVAYENLEIYQIAVEMARLIHREAKRWGNFDRDTLGKQIVRAADSIGANIAEGFGRGNGADQRRFLRIARGSVYETKHWLRLAFSRELLCASAVGELKPIMDKLPPKLNAYMRAVGRDRDATVDLRHSTIDNQHSD